MPWMGNVEYEVPAKQAYERVLCPFCRAWQPLDVAVVGAHNKVCAARYVSTEGIALFVRVRSIGGDGRAVFTPPRRRVAINALKHAAEELGG
jgi:hypothetical protein